jgi:hypothetical protein
MEVAAQPLLIARLIVQIARSIKRFALSLRVQASHPDEIWNGRALRSPARNQ